MERSRGKLTIFLGYAAGVGKTYRMLTEARRYRDAGRDVVIGYFEPHARAETIAQTEGLEFVPRCRVEHRGAVFEDMDTDAVIARHPDIAVVDEFAHTNPPGSVRLKRWEDVMAILDAGIDVLTSMNVQHIESLNDQVRHVTRVTVRETVPDWVIEAADEVVMVDVTPRALIHRLERGVVYAPDKAQKALENFFTESNLTALREMALRQTAHQIEPAPSEVSRERILILLTDRPSTAMAIRRASRVANFLGCAITAVYLESQASAVGPWIEVCANLHIAARSIPGTVQSIADEARASSITQIFVTRDAPGIEKLVDAARDFQITIVAHPVAI